MTVFQRGRAGSANWSPVAGLIDIPPSVRSEARAFVREANRRVGFVKFQIV